MNFVKHQTAQPVKNVWNDFFLNAAWQQPSFASQAAVNIAETEKGFRLEVAAPGFDKENFSIKIEKSVLTISAKKEIKEGEQTPNGTYRRREFATTAFERSFKLPETIDSETINATLSNGILHVELAKKPELVPAVKTINIA